MFIFQFLFFYNPFLNTSDIFTEIHTNLIYFFGGDEGFPVSKYN